MPQDYYIITCRYICYRCEEKAAVEKERAKRRWKQDCASSQRLTRTEAMLPTPLTRRARARRRTPFRGWNATSRALLPFGKGAEFPAFLTHKGAVDLQLTSTGCDRWPTLRCGRIDLQRSCSSCRRSNVISVTLCVI